MQSFHIFLYFYNRYQSCNNKKAIIRTCIYEAYYNRTIAASLSPMIVQEDMIEKWDGKIVGLTKRAQEQLGQIAHPAIDPKNFNQIGIRRVRKVKAKKT